MSLKRYLAIFYGLSVVLLLSLFAAASSSMSGVSFGEYLVFALVSAAVYTYVQVGPFAASVPPERRTDFWAYRRTNLFLIVPGGLLIVALILAGLRELGLF